MARSATQQQGNLRVAVCAGMSGANARAAHLFVVCLLLCIRCCVPVFLLAPASSPSLVYCWPVACETGGALYPWLNKRWWRWVPGTKVGTELEFHTYREVGVRINDPPGQWSKQPHSSMPRPTRKDDLVGMYIHACTLTIPFLCHGLCPVGQGKGTLRDCGLLEASGSADSSDRTADGIQALGPNLLRKTMK